MPAGVENDAVADIVDVNISGIIDNFVINDVDVTACVEAELERRHPGRAKLGAMKAAP